MSSDGAIEVELAGRRVRVTVTGSAGDFRRAVLLAEDVLRDIAGSKRDPDSLVRLALILSSRVLLLRDRVDHLEGELQGLASDVVRLTGEALGSPEKVSRET